MSRDVELIKSKLEIPNLEMFNNLVEQFNKEQYHSEAAVSLVFEKFSNLEVEDILVKCIVLNNRYSAGLNDNVISESKRKEKNESGEKITVDVITMAEHIYKNRELFDRVQDINDVINLVEVIRYVGDEYKDAYSFATKYCSWSLINTEINIPIVDSKVKEVLYRLNEKKNYRELFTQDSMKDYDTYVRIYADFVKYCGFGGMKYKDIDKCLWQYAKNIERQTGLEMGI